MKAPFCFLLAAMLFASCSSDEPVAVLQTDAPANPYKVTPEEAQVAVLDFLEAFDQSAQTRSASPRTVCNVKALRKSAAATRAALGENDLNLDTLLYVVNFSDSAGYALVAADKRTTPILAIIDKGNYDFQHLAQEENEGFLMFLEQAIDMEMQDIAEFQEGEKGLPEASLTRASSGQWKTKSQLGPILQTKWGQGSPSEPNSYGKYCPNKLGGCVPTAVAQILSHYKFPNQVSWREKNQGGSAPLDWERILADSKARDGKLSSDDTPQSLDQVAHLLRYLGMVMDASYDKGSKKKRPSTGVKRGKAMDWFNKTHVVRASKLRDYDQRAIVHALKAGNLVFARGNSTRKRFIITWYKGGHAWVYDGYLVATKHAEEKTMLHCNWGWGGWANGYYLDRVFNTNIGPEISDWAGGYRGNAGNFPYNLEYSIISR